MDLAKCTLLTLQTSQSIVECNFELEGFKINLFLDGNNIVFNGIFECIRVYKGANVLQIKSTPLY